MKNMLLELLFFFYINKNAVITSQSKFMWTYEVSMTFYLI